MPLNALRSNPSLQLKTKSQMGIRFVNLISSIRLSFQVKILDGKFTKNQANL